jgi:hypothetical protein
MIHSAEWYESIGIIGTRYLWDKCCFSRTQGLK